MTIKKDFQREQVFGLKRVRVLHNAACHGEASFFINELLRKEKKKVLVWNSPLNCDGKFSKGLN